MSKKVAIIGAGTAGCAAAYQFERLGGWSIDIFEGGNTVGAGVRTQFYGGHPYTFGPRHFLTRNQAVFDYFNSIVPMRLLKHRFLTYLEEEADFFSYPISALDIPRMRRSEQIQRELAVAETLELTSPPRNLEEYWISKVGETLYGKFIDSYSKKMWQVNDNREIDTFNWSPKGTPIKKDSSHGWSEAISAYPIALNGYNDFFDRVPSFARVNLKTPVDEIRPDRMEVVVKGETHKFDKIVNTIPLDSVIKEDLGSLPFVGRDLITIILPVEHLLPPDVFFLYYANAEPYTRIVEYKKFSNYQAPTTLIGLEIPSGNGKHYPLPIKKFYAIHEEYLKRLNSNIYTIGRAGKYDYQVDIDDCIEQALGIYDELR
jgi:UDP-galactopyranose mutase